MDPVVGKHLPVPPLDQTLQGFLTAVRPLLDEKQFAATSEAVARFATGDGPVCQDALLAFADSEDAEGRSWLSDAWLATYLAGRTPLPLTSNVGFALDLGDIPPGVAGAAGALRRIADVHLGYLRGDITVDLGPRGPLCLQQWDCLAGGLRHPEPDVDVYRWGPSDAADREIGVLRDGAYHAVRISDSEGRVLSADTLRAALEQVMAARPDQLFTLPSYLGSAAASGYLGRLLRDPANARLYQRLTDAVFVLNLTTTTSAGDEELRDVTFAPGRAWAYKPITYQLDPSDGSAAMHVEHSIVDGSTLKAVVARIQRAEPAESSDVEAAVERLAWRLEDDLAERLRADERDYRATAARYQVRTVQVPMALPTDLPFKLSQDACQQFVMLYAQLATYGRVRSTYEAVDMRDYQAGRTECLRPNSPQAVGLARALIDGRARPEQLNAALDEHRARVRVTKSGQGSERHLFGLRFIAERLGRRPDLFVDPGFAALTSDLLSTTSVGDQHQLKRYAFAPTIPEGIGIAYNVIPGGYEFCLSYHADRVERLDDFVTALADGADALGALIARAAR
ncbi:choline/carnitine O-acyltransferase [Nigerium massiliense]|uniref:choline/carnitine O-acyltransferase n=1 Tax=Nigerium massiliense TaxID=1522317 RepID=UPI000693262E|nr:choline/carnitine O-acyltransferase [Nigerium massiliense]